MPLAQGHEQAVELATKDRIAGIFPVGAAEIRDPTIEDRREPLGRGECVGGAIQPSRDDGSDPLVARDSAILLDQQDLMKIGGR